MSKLLTVTKFLEQLTKAKNSNTVYVKGGYGENGTKSHKEKALKAYKQNFPEEIKNANTQTYFFDCVCLVKAVLRGWDGANTPNGTLHIQSEVPDCTCEKLIQMCYNVNPMSRTPQVGALLYMSGHVGVYIGDGRVIECCPSKHGVANTALNYQKWTKWGLLPWVDYEEKKTPFIPSVGKAFHFCDVPLYISSDATKPVRTVTGDYYLTDGKQFCGSRFRICKTRQDVGKLDKVIGYIDKREV